MVRRHRSAVLAALLAAVLPVAAQDADVLSASRVAAVRAYIKSAWTTLTRSTRDLARAAPDPKVHLLADGEVELARDMVDNFLYEIEHYGTILNANRTYYLTRSQPPFLTEMILGVFERTGDREWLRRTLPAIEKYHRFWTSGPH